MNFTIEWDEHVISYLKKLPKPIAQRIYKKIDAIQENPFHFLEHYEGKYYKLRIGDYRALIDINFETNKLIVQLIDKRSRIYKK